MNTFVIDASIAVKWVVDEDGTPEALALRQRAKLIAPELLVAECANILWKKVQRDELLKEEALLAARLLQGAEIELLPMRSLFEECRLVTADERFLRKLHQGRLRTRAVSLIEAVKLIKCAPGRYRKWLGFGIVANISMLRICSVPPIGYVLAVGSV